MKHARAGILSVRAVNEYRRRDTLAYLGLRLYLDNAAACTDDWAQEIAVNSILRRSNPIYFRTSHFKEMSGGGSPEHRSIFLPSATEALAEAVLLRECSRRGRAFRNPPVAFSYRLKAGDDRRGLFEHYMRGIRDRQHRISDACEGCPDGVIRYADIRKFYPSISTELAAKAWHTCSESGQLPIQFRNLGEKLIVDQSRVLGVESRGILTGPMFSHLLGNLVLRRIDEEFGANPLVKYFRYVDDIILVGERDAVRLSLEALRNRLAEQQLELHDDESPKSYGVSTGDWLEGRRDFDQNVRADSWPSLICDLKHFLLVNPDLTGALQLAFRAESFRLPVRD